MRVNFETRVEQTITIWRIDTGEAICTFLNTNCGARRDVFNKDVSARVQEGVYHHKKQDVCKSARHLWHSLHNMGFWETNDTIPVQPSPDHKKAASFSGDDVIIWDLESHTQVLIPSSHEAGEATCLAWSSDSKLIATGRHDKTVIMSDVVTGTQIMEPLKGHSGSVLYLVLDTKASFLVSASLDKTMAIWELQGCSKGTVRHTLKVPTLYVDSISLSPDDKFLLSGSSSAYLVRIWDVCTGHQIRVIMGMSSSSIESVVWSPDCQHVTSIVSEGKSLGVKTVDAQVGEQEHNVMCMHCHSHNNLGLRNDFQRFWVPVYYWKTVEKPETDPQLLCEWQ